MNQTRKKSQKATEKLPKRAKRTWHCRTDAVGFLINKGGPYGVKLILDSRNAKRLKAALKTCLDIAKDVGIDKVQIDAHWGHKATAKGFILDVRVALPEKKS
jgi:hypothetical protein